MVLPASGVRVSARPRSGSRGGPAWRWARCMRRGTGAVCLTVQALQLTNLLLLSSLRSLLLSSLSCLLLGALGSLLLSSLSCLLLGSLRCLLLSSLRSLLLGSLSCLLLGSLSCLLLGSLGSLLLRLLGPLLPRKSRLRSAQPSIWARLRGRNPGRLIRLSPRRYLYARPLPLHILR
jgi:hypothetical protein